MALTVEIGAAIIDRGSQFLQTLLDYVVIEQSSPATVAGTIYKAGVYMSSVGNPPSVLRFGTFYKTNGNSFTYRDYSDLVSASVGYNEYDVNLDVQIGDYIGIWLNNNNGLELDTSGGIGYWYVESSVITIVAQACIYTANYIVSIGGEIGVAFIPQVIII